MNEQPIDAEAIINDLLEQLKQATLQLAILRSVVRRYEQQVEGEPVAFPPPPA